MNANLNQTSLECKILLLSKVNVMGESLQFLQT